MESCSSEDDISSSEPRRVEDSKEGSGRGIGREKGRERGRGRVRGRASGSGRGRRTGEASSVPHYMWTSADSGRCPEIDQKMYCMQKLNKTKISGTEPADLPFVGQKPGPNLKQNKNFRYRRGHGDG